MALQDLTPQLRTRLSRLERLVGLFVAVAALLLVAGLCFYVYRVAERKGWFVRKLPYFTFVKNANGLKVGDPISLMGFDIGEIKEINAQPPFDYYDVYVAFVVKERYVGYLWDDSRAVVASTDFLGKRSIEVTKGTNMPPNYLFHEMRSVPLTDSDPFIDSTNQFLAQAVYDRTGTNLLAQPYQPLTHDRKQRFMDGGVDELLFFEKSAGTKWPSGIWNPQQGRYEPFDRRVSKGYFLPPLEAPALAARLEKVADTVEAALPNLLGLTNRVNRVLDQANETARSADEVLRDVRPLLVNLNRISRNLTNSQGALGEWLFAPELRDQLSRTLTSANSLLTNSDHQVDGLSSNLTVVLVNLADVTSNLNAQVTANSNILSEISSAVTNADHLMQGLKRHWLLRSAFKDRPSSGGKPRSSSGRAVAPKYSEPRR